MVDVASITVAVVSLVASLGVAITSGFLTIYTDDRKAHQETERLLRKYRDPLLLAAQDLQSRIYNITEQTLLTFLYGTQSEQDCLVIYTAFLFGQYLCWTYILRQQAQFVCFATEENGRTKLVVDLFGRIQRCLNTDDGGEAESPFMLWKGHQLAIGELMTVSKQDPAGTSELHCMGFAEFTRKWKAGCASKAIRSAAANAAQSDANGVSGDGFFAKAAEELQLPADNEVFLDWFSNIQKGIHEIDRRSDRGDSGCANRIRRLHHLLLELIDVLDPQGARVGARDSLPVKAAPQCACSRCRASFVKPVGSV